MALLEVSSSSSSSSSKSREKKVSPATACPMTRSDGCRPLEVQATEKWPSNPQSRHTSGYGQSNWKWPICPHLKYSIRDTASPSLEPLPGWLEPYPGWALRE
jgi:hypothetical protein